MVAIVGLLELLLLPLCRKKEKCGGADGGVGG